MRRGRERVVRDIEMNEELVKTSLKKLLSMRIKESVEMGRR